MFEQNEITLLDTTKSERINDESTNIKRRGLDAKNDLGEDDLEISMDDFVLRNKEVIANGANRGGHPEKKLEIKNNVIDAMKANLVYKSSQLEQAELRITEQREELINSENTIICLKDELDELCCEKAKHTERFEEMMVCKNNDIKLNYRRIRRRAKNQQ